MAGIASSLFFPAGQRLEFGRGLLRQPSCDAQRFGKILGVEPVEVAHRFIRAFLPDAGSRDVESHMELLVDGLDAMAGDRPLPSEPVNVAMQGHYRFRIGAGRFATLYFATLYEVGVLTARAGFGSADWNRRVFET